MKLVRELDVISYVLLVKKREYSLANINLAFPFRFSVCLVGGELKLWQDFDRQRASPRSEVLRRNKSFTTDKLSIL